MRKVKPCPRGPQLFFLGIKKIDLNKPRFAFLEELYIYINNKVIIIKTLKKKKNFLRTLQRRLKLRLPPLPCEGEAARRERRGWRRGCSGTFHFSSSCFFVSLRVQGISRDFLGLSMDCLGFSRVFNDLVLLSW